MEQVRNESTIYSTAIYCRLSKDDEQAGESVSIETQKLMVTDFSPLVGGDGVSRQLVQIPGWINDTEGVFEYIFEPDGTCNHRFFRTFR